MFCSFSASPHNVTHVPIDGPIPNCHSQRQLASTFQHVPVAVPACLICTHTGWVVGLAAGRIGPDPRPRASIPIHIHIRPPSAASRAPALRRHHSCATRSKSCRNSNLPWPGPASLTVRAEIRPFRNPLGNGRGTITRGRDRTSLVRLSFLSFQSRL